MAATMTKARDMQESVEQIQAVYFESLLPRRVFEDRTSRKELLAELVVLDAQLREHCEQIQHECDCTVIEELEEMREELLNYVDRLRAAAETLDPSRAAAANIESMFHEMVELLYDFDQVGHSCSAITISS